MDHGFLLLTTTFWQVFNSVEIKPEMTGHYLGEFSCSYRPVKHGRPGVSSPSFFLSASLLINLFLQIGATHCMHFVLSLPFLIVTNYQLVSAAAHSLAIVRRDPLFMSRTNSKTNSNRLPVFPSSNLYIFLSSCTQITVM